MSRYNIRLKTLLSWCIAACSAAFMTACVDEIPGYGLNDIPEGEVTVDLQAAFSPFTESILSRSTTIPGNAMADISDLCLLAYGTDGRLIDNEYFRGGVMQIVFAPSDVKDEPRDDHDASNGDKAEASTKCLKKTLTLPTGRYYLIAVANLGQYTRNENGSVREISSTFDALKAGGRYAGKYDTLDELRAMTVGWDLENDANNREMLGFFTGSKDNVPSHTSSFTPVTVDRAGLTLHTWLRRCASKVTIDFDGSELRENVRVYLKEARIYDIPKECTLGFGLKSDSEGGNYNNAAGKDGIYTASEPHLTNAIIYGEGDDHKAWPAITKGTPYGAYIEDGTKSADYDYSSLHSETADALFFYENMQGDAPRDKFQIADLNNGGVQGADDIKDGIPYGTYIEVVGHYYSTANGAVSEGDIKYRFMLGKDVKRNCDAERNYHYKLTLRLRGNANDYDWHIDYKDSKPFDIPNPWYVSYLYNHDASLPFKYIVPDGYEVVKFVAKITENPWYPANGQVPSGEKSTPYNLPINRDNGNGFLSLRETDKIAVSAQDATGAAWSGYVDANATINSKYYLGQIGGNVNRSERTYYVDGRDITTGVSEREQYTYQKDGKKIAVNIPLFTRAKVLVKQTGYSGNNPFVGYERHAKLEITPYIRPIGTSGDGEPQKSESTTVVQVRRIVNPKGVYRRSNNCQDFHVSLMYLPDDDNPTFETFDSDGPWMAEIIGDKNFITLDGKQIVTGSTKTPVDFKIKFNKFNTSGSNKNAVVRIKYNNYTCVHLIFVRQGYDPQQLSHTGKHYVAGNDHGVGGQKATVWSTFNLLSHKVEATDPRDEGSMFKHGNRFWGISSKSNIYRDKNGNPIYIAPSDDAFKTPPPIYIVGGNGFVEEGAQPAAWTDFHKGSEFGKIDIDGKKLATPRDFEQLYITDNIWHGFGVLYADGATETQELVSQAYGWSNEDNDNTRGMRGLFAYYWNREDPSDDYNGRNVFFPIGRSGYGHRKNERNGPLFDEDGKNIVDENNKNVEGLQEVGGTLRYSCGQYYYRALFENTAPLFCNLYRRQGAVYYAQWITGKNEYIGWDNNIGTDGVFYGLDINYYTFDVNAITSANVSDGEDACFLRCVK